MKTIIIFSAVMIICFTNCYSQEKNISITIGGGINQSGVGDGFYNSGFNITGMFGTKVWSDAEVGMNLNYFSYQPYNYRMEDGQLLFKEVSTTHNVGLKAYLKYGTMYGKKNLYTYALISPGVSFSRYTSGEYTEYGKFNASKIYVQGGLDLGVGMGYKINESASLFIQPTLNATFNIWDFNVKSLSLIGGLNVRF